METMFRAGARVYDVNTKQTGRMLTDPRPLGSDSREIVIVEWDNGRVMTVYADHLRACA